MSRAILRQSALLLDVSSGPLSSLLQSLQDHPPRDVTDRFDFPYLNLPAYSQKILLQCMAAFASSVEEEVVIEVCSQPDGAIRCADDLRELVRKALVEYEEDSMRYRLHPLMRQYAEAKSGKATINEYRKRAAVYFLGYAEKFTEDPDNLEADRDNILAGMDFAAAMQRSADKEAIRAASGWTLSYMSSIDNYLDIRGYWDEWRLRLQQAIDATEIIGEKKEKVAWIHNLGILNQKTGYYDEARRLYQESLKIEQELGDKRSMAQTLAQFALLEEKDGNNMKALDLIEQAEGLFLELKSPTATQARRDRERLEKIQ